MEPHNKTMVTRGDGDIGVFGVELRHNSKARYIDDLWNLGEELHVVENFETPNGAWAAAHVPAIAIFGVVIVSALIAAFAAFAASNSLSMPNIAHRKLRIEKRT